MPTPLPPVNPVLPRSETQSSGTAQRDWIVSGRTGWEFKGPGHKGGGDEPGSSPASVVFTCQDCLQTMTTKFKLKSHQKFYCPKRGLDHFGLDHLAAANSSGRGVPSESQKSKATTYKVDSDMPDIPGKGKYGPKPCSPMYWCVIWRTRHFPGGPV